MNKPGLYRPVPSPDGPTPVAADDGETEDGEQGGHASENAGQDRS
jgi:hypothetical protein